MELICNELSFLPLAQNTYELEERYAILIKTFKTTKERYNFSHIRFPMDYGTQKVTNAQTYYEWVSSLSNRNLQALLLDLCKRPYYDDLEKKELDVFFESEYSIIDSGAPTSINPTGLPISFIKALPAISIHSHDFWLKRKINLRKINNTELKSFFAYNICIDSDVKSEEMTEWADNFMSLKITNVGILKTYLGFKKYRISFSSNFFNELMQWKDDDVDAFKYILLLMKNVELHPFTGGMGQTENLKNRGKEASKRINITDRLSYKIDNNEVCFIACKGHYNFH